jgi:hypothetical protein
MFIIIGVDASYYAAQGSAVHVYLRMCVRTYRFVREVEGQLEEVVVLRRHRPLQVQPPHVAVLPRSIHL